MDQEGRGQGDITGDVYLHGIPGTWVIVVAKRYYDV
jgi:hypothetical protein